MTDLRPVGLLEAVCVCRRQLGCVELEDGTFVLVHADCLEHDHDPQIDDG